MVIPKETYLAGKAQQGLLLHGSPKLFDTLVPHKAHSDSGGRNSNRTAVYAAGVIDKWYSEIPAQLSIAYAILDKSRFTPSSSCSIGAGVMGFGPVFMELSQDLVPTLGPGYVYVLPPAGFKAEALSIQYHSKKEVVPVEVVPVEPKDYRGELRVTNPLICIQSKTHIKSRLNH